MDYTGQYPQPLKQAEAQGQTFIGRDHEMNSEVAKVLLETQDIIDAIYTFLKGKVFVNGELRDIGKPLCNDEGCNRIVNIVSGRFNRNTILANVTHEDIKIICITLRNNLIGDFVANHEEYGIKKVADALTILNTIDDMIYLNLTRGLTEGGTGKSLLGFSKIITHKEAVSNVPQKKGLLDKVGI